MGDQRTRLWLGIGTCVLLGSNPAAADQPGTPQTQASGQMLIAAASDGAAYSHGGGGGEGGEGGEGGSAMSVFGSGGEGGEGGEGGSAPSATDNAGVYYSQLAFMLGHMQIGRELYQTGAGEIGGTHLGHPAAEHLPAVRQALAQRGFAGVIEQVEALAREGGASAEWDEVESAWTSTHEAIRDAMEDVDAEYLENPAFIVKVLQAILIQSRHEYAEAIDGGAFVMKHEYHDSRGFVEVGRDLLERKGDVLKAADADAYAELVARYEEVMEAWPTTQPPQAPAVSVSELYGRVAAVEFVLSRF